MFNVKRDNAIIHNTDPAKTINLHPAGNQVYTARGLMRGVGFAQTVRRTSSSTASSGRPRVWAL